MVHWTDEESPEPLLAIDPGSTRSDKSTTGIVYLEGLELKDSWSVPNGISGFRDWANLCLGVDFPYDVWLYDSWFFNSTVVCETFVDRQVRGADRSPMLIEGAVRFLWPDAVLQSAAGYKTQMPDEAMNALGFTKSTFPGDHHADRWAALRHALLYLRRQKDPTVLAALRSLT